MELIKDMSILIIEIYIKKKLNILVENMLIQIIILTENIMEFWIFLMNIEFIFWILFIKFIFPFFFINLF